jgi:hypothetical protein
MAKHKLGTLDQLLDKDPPVSPPFRAKIGAAEVEVAFKVLSAEAITECNIEAEQQLLRTIQRYDLPDDLLAGQVNFRELEREQSCSLMAEALVDPNSENGRAPAFSYRRLREALLPWQAEILDQKWASWQTRHDIARVTDDDIDALIEAEKKSDEDACISIILDCGTPVSLVRTLAAELAKCRTGGSSDGSSSTGSLQTGRRK